MSRQRASSIMFYGDDFIAGVFDLTPEERGIFITIIAQIVSQGGPIDDDDRRNARMSNCTPRRFATVKNALIAAGKLTLFDGKIGQKRAEIELETAENFRNRQVFSGKKGGKNSAIARKKANENNKNGQAVLEPTLVAKFKPPEPEPEPIEEREERRLSRKSDSLTNLVLIAEQPDQLPDEVGAVFEEFQSMAKEFDLPCPRKLDPDRRKALAARLRDHGPDGTRTAFAAIRASPFLRGEKSSGGWKGVTLDWMLKPANFRKIIEGNYDERTTDQPALGAGLDSNRRGVVDIASIALRSIGRT